MPRKRNEENKGLPARWQFFHGAYYYRVPPGQEPAWDGQQRFRLGKTLPEAYKAYADRVRALLSHADARTTQQVYRRKPERVKPLG